ncbi:MAG: sortase [Anaerolineae bacterium]|nr:MAG: sortase [Anaerolineae bacterium]
MDDIPDGMAYLDGTYELVTQTNPPADCGSLAADFNGTFTVGDPVVTATPGTSGADITFDFGQITVNNDNNDTNNSFLICFQALLLNEAGNQNGDTLTNNATLTVTGNDYTDSADVNVVEPELQVVKTVTDPNPAPGEVVTFTLTVSHAPTSAADAFDVLIYDDIPVGLVLDPTSITVTPSAGISGVTDNSTASRIEVGVDSFPQGETLTITFDATVTASYGSPITNTAYATWTSLPGDDANERTGADGVGGSPNDYITGDSVTLNADRDLSKALVTTSLGTTTGTDVTIGEILTYQVTLTIPAGSTDTAIITDTLASGLAFLDCSQMTAGPDITSTMVDFTNPDNCNHGTTPGSNPLIENDGGKITFDLGNITNNGANPEDIVLTYRVVVLDTVANQSDVTLSNDVEWTWSTGRLTASAPAVRIIEPDMGLEKSVDRPYAFPGGELVYTIRVFHTAETQTDAYDVVLRDVIPEGLDYIPGSLRFVPGSGVAPTTLDDTGTDPTTGRPLLYVEWDNMPPGTEAQIEFRATMGHLRPGQSVANTASLEWSTLPGDVSAPQSVYNDLSTERRYDPLNPADIYQVQDSVTVEVPLLPATGFAPGRVTAIPEQPVEKSYALTDFVLEIPRLNVSVPIVGVPLRQDGWDLSWLWDEAGYLEGTAYPTWAGNTVITAHVYTPDGLPGPFVDLHTLRWGDQVIIHAYGQRYIYEVREVRQVGPDDLSVWQHETYDWVTLLTCKEFDEARGDYRYRVVVRAVLVRVEAEE